MGRGHPVEGVGLRVGPQVARLMHRGEGRRGEGREASRGAGVSEAWERVKSDDGGRVRGDQPSLR